MTVAEGLLWGGAVMLFGMVIVSAALALVVSRANAERIRRLRSAGDPDGR